MDTTNAPKFSLGFEIPSYIPFLNLEQIATNLYRYVVYTAATGNKLQRVSANLSGLAASIPERPEKRHHARAQELRHWKWHLRRLWRYIDPIIDDRCIYLPLYFVYHFSSEKITFAVWGPTSPSGRRRWVRRYKKTPESMPWIWGWNRGNSIFVIFSSLKYSNNIYIYIYITKGSLWLATWVSLYEVKGGAAVLVCELPQL